MIRTPVVAVLSDLTIQRFNESRGCCLNEMIRMSPIAFL